MNANGKIQIRNACSGDKKFWFSLDKHLSSEEFDKKIRDKQSYILTLNGCPAGILRYNLFWDNSPFCTLLYIAEEYRGTGLGKALMNFWEEEMRASGYGRLLVSTRSDEKARYFYRAIGYAECGALSLRGEPEELFLCKYLTE